MTLGAALNPYLAVALPKHLSGTIIQTTVKDTTCGTGTGTAGSQWVVNNNPLIAQTFPVGFSGFSSDNLSVATVDANGNVLYIGDGAATISLSTNGFAGGIITSSLKATMAQIPDGNTISFTSHPSDSLAKHCKDQVDALLTGSPSTTMPLYSIWNPTGGAVTKNPLNFLNGIDTSCIPVYNSKMMSAWRGCLVTPLHLISAAHVHYSYGVKFIFLGNDGVLYSSLVQTTNSVSGTDLMVVTLQTPLPTAVTPAKIMPNNAANYLPAIYTQYPGTSLNFCGNWVPVISISQLNKSCVVVTGADLLTSLGNGAVGLLQPSDTNYPNAALENSFFLQPFAGDSGGPNFLLINGQLVFLCAFSSANGGPSACLEQTEITALLSGGYTLSTINLSGFPTY